MILTIRNYRHLHGHAPTFREIADTLRISRGTAVAHVKALIRKKKLRHTPGRARTLEVVADVKDETRA